MRQPPTKRPRTDSISSPSSPVVSTFTPKTEYKTEPWVASLPDGSGIHIFFRHDLGTSVVPKFDESNHTVTLVATIKSYLVPDEFRQTEYVKKVTQWDGTFSNYGREQLREHVVVVDSEINLEEASIQRHDYSTCYGLLMELIFTKKIRNGAHLRPTRIWDFLEEGAKPGKGFAETLNAKVAEAQNQTQTQ